MRQAGNGAGASLRDCLVRLALRQGHAAALAVALPAGDHTTFEPRAMLRRARAAGLGCRTLKVRWEQLPRLLARGPVAVSFVDDTSLLLLETAVQDGVDVAVLQDPRTPGAEAIVVDRIRFARVWTGKAVVVRPRVAAGAGSLGWRAVARLVACEPRLLCDVGGATLALGLLAIVPIVVVRLIMQRVILTGSSQSLLMLGLVLFVAVVIEAILVSARGRLVSRIVGRLDARLAVDLFDRLLRLPAAALERVPAGETTRRLAGRHAIRALFDGPLLGAVLETGGALFVVPLLVILDPILTGGVMLMLVLCALGAAAAYGRVRRAAEATQQAQACRDAFLLRTLSGCSLGGRGAGRWLMLRWTGVVAAVGRTELRLARASEAIGGVTCPIERLLLAALLGFGILVPAANGGTAQLGTLVAVYLLVQRLVAPLPALANLLRAHAEAGAAMQGLAGLLNRPSEAGGTPSGTGNTVRGAILFDNVRCCYPGRATEALASVSFAVPPGAWVGITGRSGAGKSTVARLLMQHATTYTGTIRLDGIDLRDIEACVLRPAVVGVNASSALFAGTIREIITAARPDASFDTMVRAAWIAGVDSFIDTLPRSYETRLDDGAPSLSSGQRQCLALARALVTEPAVLVLDEALSALDAEIAAVVGARLRDARHGLTTIVISHRLATLADADAIVVLAEGKVRDCGSHAELMDRCAPYAAACARQSDVPDLLAAGGSLLAT